MSEQITTFRLDAMEKKLNEIQQESKEFHKTFLEKFDEMESRYAGKWVERILIGAGSVIGVTLITSLMYLIIKH